MRLSARLQRRKCRYFNPRIPYGMRLSAIIMPWRTSPISIHASRMGCDSFIRFQRFMTPNFNPRIPYGMRLSSWSAPDMFGIFQSTHPVWDATVHHAVARVLLVISIHASRMGCDVAFGPNGMTPPVFQSTHPVWDATFVGGHGHEAHAISIHASRMGCDWLQLSPWASSRYFNPRIPYGMRPGFCWFFNNASDFNPRIPYGMRLARCFKSPHSSIFQSTHPVWDATGNPLSSSCSARISIHASRMGCDHSVVANGSRLPPISIHASRMGCD